MSNRHGGYGGNRRMALKDAGASSKFAIFNFLQYCFYSVVT